MVYPYTCHCLLSICAQKFFRRKPVKDLLPPKPVTLKVLEPWWNIQIGFITEDDIRVSENHLFTTILMKILFVVVVVVVSPPPHTPCIHMYMYTTSMYIMPPPPKKKNLFCLFHYSVVCTCNSKHSWNYYTFVLIFTYCSLLCQRFKGCALNAERFGLGFAVITLLT